MNTSLTSGNVSQKTILLAVFAVFLSTFGFDGSVSAFQVLSPNSTPTAGNRQQTQSSTPQKQNPVESSQKLLVVIDKMVPFEIAGSELEAEYIEAARSFVIGQLEDAVKKLDALAAKRTDAPPTPMLIASMAYAFGQSDRGRLWLEKAAKDFPDHPASFIGFARFSSADNRIADAEAMLEKVDRLCKAGTWTDEQNRLFRMEYLDVRSEISVKQQNLELAKKSLLELEKMLPENNRVPIRLAQVEFDLKNIDSSLAYLRKAKKTSSQLRVPEVVLAEWFLKMKNVTASEEWMLKAASENPENPDVQLDYAQWLLENEKLQEALNAVTKAEALKANEYVVGYLKGQISFARQAYDLAEAHFETLVKLKPRDADATNMLALSLIESKIPTKMSRDLELAVTNQRVYPRSPTAMATVGWAYYRNGKMAEAETAFRQLLQTNSLEPASAFFVATYLEQQGDMPGAKQLLDKCLASSKYFMFRASAVELQKRVNDRMPQVPESDEAVDGVTDSPEKTGNE